MKYQAIDIANALIEIGIQKGTPISNMKLQKMLYYTQGWYMALTNKEELFPENFEKWGFGPVCPSVYYKFKKNKAEPIEVIYPSSGPITDQMILKFLYRIWDVYGKYSALDLSRHSHKEGPWKYTEDYEVISKEKIYNHFHYLLQKRK